MIENKATKEIIRLIKRRMILEQERDRNRRRNSSLAEQIRGIQDVLGGGAYAGSGDDQWMCLEIGLSPFLALYPQATAKLVSWEYDDGSHTCMVYEKQFFCYSGKTAIWVEAKTAEVVTPKAVAVPTEKAA